MNDNEKTISIEISRRKAIIIFISSIVIFLLAIILWMQQRFDNNILINCNYFFEKAIYHNFFKFVSRYGMGIISLSYSILIFLSLKNKNLAHNNTLFMFILFSFGIGSIAGDLLKEVVDRARPAAELTGFLLQTEISDTPSFPSGHTVKSMSLALPFVIMALNKDSITKLFKIILLLLAIMVSISRIALQKHYLSDILAGIAVALFFMLIAIYITNRIYKRKNFTEMKIAQLTKKYGFVFIVLAVLLYLF